MIPFPPGEDDIVPAEQPDEYLPVFGQVQVQGLVQLIAVHLRKFGDQVDVSAEEIAAIQNCSVRLLFNPRRGALRVLLVDPDAKIWSTANVNYAGHA